MVCADITKITNLRWNLIIRIAAGPYYARYSQSVYIPADTKHLYTIYTMMDRRRRRWADVV